ncbi:MAG: ketopantoate reductase family protein [Pseudomonadota bacterium]
MNVPVWHILGTGSIGSLFARRLAATGFPVVPLPRGSTRTPPPALLMVCTKVQDTEDALLPHITGSGTGQLAMLLQNGMGMAERLRARWPDLRLWNAVTTAGAWRDAGNVLHVVAEGETRAGRHDTAGHAVLDDGVLALAAAGLLTVDEPILPVLWRKLAVNAVINPLTALHGCRNGELETHPETRSLLAPLAAEIDAVARTEGVALDTLALATSVLRSTAGNFSSMNRDLAQGRRTEIGFITGHVVACAQRHGIDVPLNRALLEAVLQRETPPAGA